MVQLNEFSSNETRSQILSRNKNVATGQIVVRNNSISIPREKKSWKSNLFE